MMRLLRIAWVVMKPQAWSLLRGALLAFIVLVAGAGLLGLSGWFITAAGVAGLAGIGIGFDFFRPSAGVRFLALGRTAARYGERVLTHDAVLRSLAALRIRLLRALAAQPFDRILAQRTAERVNRLTMDVDALDGVALRLVIPVVSGLLALALVFGLLWVLVGASLVWWLALSYLAGTLAALAWVFCFARKPSRAGQIFLDACRIRVADLLRGRRELAVAGRLDRWLKLAQAAARRRSAARLAQDRVERVTGGAIALAELVALAGALLLGAALVRAGTVDAPLAALGFFVTLALGEVVAPLRRGLAEYGRMADAAGRMAPLLEETAAVPVLEASESGAVDISRGLELRAVTFAYPNAAAPVVDAVTVTVAPGETVALTGRSGSGKSTLLAMAAGLVAPQSGEVRVAGLPLGAMDGTALRGLVTMLPQRSQLVSGTIRENLALARPGLAEEEAWAVLRAARLEGVIAARGGLDSPLGESGAGLSGGEARRLALARTLLRRPAVLLLDEPTEGLDRETADGVLAGIRAMLPRAAILLASHREAEKAFAGRCVTIGS
ncbi:thiol reductant ABC exporter subunit CydC [Zhengella mangrovi]|uniref:Thiol reductant ABC exporter subunit CydC n=1 Tax=Zhengella mangrovi TaxID=1982044 RepID=A0A2G1QGR5_9HYPH|nr:thiol reductant ABC exporter subunit CydC [Zhengella mangrovi]PHP64717.1 thiol reductant ABC exporter subunit CydC [Zhengella mangrovi]